MNALIPILSLALLSLVAAETGPENEKLHEQMTAEEVRHLFHAEPHEVPDYKIVPIHWPNLHKRAAGSGPQLRINAFGSNITLWLNPLHGVIFAKNTPVYFAKAASATDSTLSFEKIPHAMAKIAKVYEDEKAHASLVVKRSASGTYLISGYIGSQGWAVKPVPDRFRRHLNAKYRKSTDELSEITGGEHHVVYKIPRVPNQREYLSEPIEDAVLNIKARRSRRSSPKFVYPQVLLMIDDTIFKAHNESITDLLEYLVPFWNAVDLRYRALENPRVRINIAGIVVSKDPKDFAFITDHKFGDADMLDVHAALNSFGLYMPTINSSFPKNSYDIATAMTWYPMCSTATGPVCKPGPIGLAYIGGACKTEGPDGSKTRSVSIVRDRGGYDGVHPAAHEMGHLFGANHDGQGNRCPLGNIMSPQFSRSDHGDEWSSCSVRAFNHFFNVNEPKCLYDRPKTSASLPRVLPGKYLSVDEQCKNIHGTNSCPITEKICQQLSCMDLYRENRCTPIHQAAADGSTCGENKICLHGRCMDEKDLV